MNPTRRNMWLAITAVAVVQAAALGWMIAQRIFLLESGREIVLDVVPVDPRSLFRGDYVILNYDISRVEFPPGQKPLRRGSLVYVTLQRTEDDRWRVAGTRRSPPERAGPDQVVLKGRVRYVSAASRGSKRLATVRYGIESYFVPEGAGRELEKLVGEKKLAAVIAVDGSGNAAVKGLIVDGQRVYEEPLL